MNLSFQFSPELYKIIYKATNFISTVKVDGYVTESMSYYRIYIYVTLQNLIHVTESMCQGKTYLNQYISLWDKIIFIELIVIFEVIEDELSSRTVV